MGPSRPQQAAPPRASHVLHLHDEDASYYGALVPYLASALRGGQGAIAIVTREHALGLADGLRELGIDVDAVIADEQLALVDASAVMAAIAPGDAADAEAFSALVAARVDRMLARWPRIAALGEVVDLLAEAGRMNAVLELEGLWNQLLEDRPMSLWCAYRLAHFADAAAAAPFARVCTAHGDAHPLPDADGSGGRRTMLARLQQQTLALSTEVAERRALEARIDTQYSLTAALARATSTVEAAEVAATVIAGLAGACAILVQRVTDDGGREVLAARGMIEGAAVRAACQASAAPVATGAASVVALAMAIGDRSVGEVVLGFEPARRFPGRDRGLFEAVTSQLAQALERIRLHDATRDALDRLLDTERRRAELLATLGHELRDPLASILTAAELLRIHEDGARREPAVIEEQARHLARLLDELLDLSALDQGAVQLRPMPHEIASIVSWALDTHAPLIEQRGHAVTVTLEPDLPRVELDAERMAQVIGHLLGNAARYTPAGGHIDITARHDDGTVEIAVRDDGPGIPPALLAQAFEPFVPGRSSLARSVGGLGVGLSLALRLTELHGGTLSASSDVTGGSIFRVRLPVAGSIGAAPCRPAMLRARKVLVVDDNEDAATLIAGALRHRGHRVAVAHDGPSALARAESFSPEVILLDLGLPGVDGLDVARHLRGAGSPVRLVAITGYGAPADREATRDAGFDAHLVKPVSLSAIEQALGGDDDAAPPAWLH